MHGSRLENPAGPGSLFLVPSALPTIRSSSTSARRPNFATLFLQLPSSSRNGQCNLLVISPELFLSDMSEHKSTSTLRNRLHAFISDRQRLDYDLEKFNLSSSPLLRPARALATFSYQTRTLGAGPQTAEQEQHLEEASAWLLTIQVSEVRNVSSETWLMHWARICIVPRTRPLQSPILRMTISPQMLSLHGQRNRSSSKKRLRVTFSKLPLSWSRCVNTGHTDHGKSLPMQRKRS